MSRTIIPFGPQHPVLPEPIHLQLVMDNETVVEALPKLGYVHRGLETLTTLRDYNQMIYIVERVCGICSCIHALCFCRAIEHLMDVEVPRRAAYLRIIWSELHRMHSHLLWLGLFEAFAELGFTPVSVLDGDCWARTKVRFLEVLQSMEIVRQAISHLPDTEINVKVKGNPSGEVISRVEQPRGECMYYVKGNGSKYLDRVRIRTPTFANIPPLLHMVKGIQLADVPVVVLSIDPCISCTER